MNRIFLSLAALSILATGCGRSALEAQTLVPTEARPTAEKAAASIAKDDSTDEAIASELAANRAVRSPGDFVVYKFTGSFRAKPLTLTERVIAKKGDALLIDITADEGKSKQELRVKMSDAPGRKNEILSVAKLENGAEKPSDMVAYDALMAKTILAADQNESTVGVEDVTIDVAGTKLLCHRTTFLVKIGKKTATMRTIESSSFGWGDVGGDITASNGKTLYKAEVVDLGHVDPSQAPAVAHFDADE